MQKKFKDLVIGEKFHWTDRLIRPGTQLILLKIPPTAATDLGGKSFTSYCIQGEAKGRCGHIPDDAIVELVE